MSADNGIYILKTKDQIRVIHAQAIDNLTWSYLDEEFWRHNPGKYVPTRIVEYFGNNRYTYKMEVAENVARSMLHNQMICEYGIVHLNPYNKTWKHILVEAKEYAKLEWDKIKDYSDSYYKHEANRLLKIINGEYC